MICLTESAVLASFFFCPLPMTCTEILTTQATYFAKGSDAFLSGNQVASNTDKLAFFAFSSLLSHAVDTTDWEDWRDDIIRSTSWLVK